MSKHYETDQEETQIALCEVCDNDIVIDNYADLGDSFSCEECGAVYVLKSFAPLRLKLVEGDDDESLQDLDFDD